MAALLILFPERAARPTRGGGHGGAGTRSQGPSIHLAKLTLRWKRLPSGCQFSTLEEAGEVFGNTHGKRNPVVVSVTNKIQVRCDTSTVYLHIYSAPAQMGSMCLLTYLRLHISAGTPWWKQTTEKCNNLFCHRVELFVDNNLCLSVVW